MLNVYQIIDEYKIELLKNTIGKKISSILLAPSNIYVVSGNKFNTLRITINIFDCFEAGCIDIKSSINNVLIDEKMHQNLYFGLDMTILENYNPSVYDFSTSRAPQPSYGTQFFYDKEDFIINKIEIYRKEIVMNSQMLFESREKVNSESYQKDVQFLTDNIILIYGENDKILFIESEDNILHLYTDKDVSENIIASRINKESNPSPLFLYLAIA